VFLDVFGSLIHGGGEINISMDVFLYMVCVHVRVCVC
jgi:hypothetical protein